MKAAILFALMAFALPAAAERAASIEYEFVARPASVPAEYDGPGLRFLAIKAIDGARVDAALWPGSSTLVVSVHGSGDSFHNNPNGFLAKGLAAKGYAMLGINTRQSGPRVNTDNFLEVRRDIEAAVYTARALGYRSLVLHGNSLGNIQVQFYAATNWEADIRAVVLTGMFGNLPWKSRHLLVQNEDNWSQLADAAMKGLMVRDEGDVIVQAFEPPMLLSAATSAGSLVPSIKYVNLPNPKRGPAEHYFVNNREPLIETIAAWLREQKL